MALCLAESLIETKSFDPLDQIKKYLRWYRDGYMSSTGKCFGVGRATARALHEFERTGNPYSGSEDSRSAGNGSLMRLAPVPLFFAWNTAAAMEMSGESSRTTHGAKTCIDACRHFGGLIAGIIRGTGKAELLSERYSPIEGYWTRQPLHPEIAEIAEGSFKRKKPPDIAGSGYVVKTLEAALWAFHHTQSFEEGCLAVVNLGDDADTTGAVYGQVAGAYYGSDGIPEKWKAKIAFRDFIESTADRLYDLSLKYR